VQLTGDTLSRDPPPPPPPLPSSSFTGADERALDALTAERRAAPETERGSARAAPRSGEGGQPRAQPRLLETTTSVFIWGGGDGWRVFPPGFTLKLVSGGERTTGRVSMASPMSAACRLFWPVALLLSE